MKSKFACMAHWLKITPDEAASSSRGADRKTYLENFMVFQMRQQQMTKEVSPTSTVGTVRANHSERRWRSRETMDKELGEKKAQSWRSSGKLQTRPDPVTGSTDDDFIEYGCPADWTAFTAADKESHEVRATGEADEADLDLLNGVKNTTTAELKDVKVEPKSTEDIAKDEAKALLNNPRPMLRRMQDYELECKVLATKAGSNKYTTELATDANKFIT